MRLDRVIYDCIGIPGTLAKGLAGAHFGGKGPVGTEERGSRMIEETNA